MFRSSISKKNKALCFVINKGYFETRDLEEMLELLDVVKNTEIIILVGSIEKVRLSGSRSIVYRQRVFFKSLRTMLAICKVQGLKFELARSFRISINNIMNCIDELVFLERYASKFDQTIDEWLTNCCIVHLNYLLLSMNMYSDLVKHSARILRGREGYLDRAPFLVSSYDIDRKSSGIFLELNTKDTRLYSEPINDILYLTYGYTTRNVSNDVRGGVFK